MKLLHLADLHLGKRVYEYSMLDDQRYILSEILDIIDIEEPDGVMIAGDVYDKAVPPTDAVALFDSFLVDLAKRKLPVFVISGNHDSPERLAFANRLIDASGIHLSSVYDGQAARYVLKDEWGPVNIYMLPFVRPSTVRPYFDGEEISSYTDAIHAAVSQMGIDPSERNVLMAHQFVTGAVTSESEDISVGGLDNVDASVFDGFDYVALGHIHTPQNIGSERVRYSGTPLKYSFSEVGRDKSVTVAQLGPKGTLDIREVPLKPRYDMVELRGTYEELTLRDFYKDTGYREDYVHITLTDENDVPDAVSKLRVIYPKLMKLDYDNARTRADSCLDSEYTEQMQPRSPFGLFSDFYEQCNNTAMTAEQSSFVQKLMEEIWESEI